jgi:hypothetical protein
MSWASVCNERARYYSSEFRRSPHAGAMVGLASLLARVNANGMLTCGYGPGGKQKGSGSTH